MTVTHRDGTHDDFILAVAMAVFVTDVCYPSGFQDYTNPMGDETEDTVTTGSRYKWNI
jgi:hypothetical protein